MKQDPKVNFGCTKKENLDLLKLCKKITLSQCVLKKYFTFKRNPCLEPFCHSVITALRYVNKMSKLTLSWSALKK